jgi:hypothetical protein
MPITREKAAGSQPGLSTRRNGAVNPDVRVTSAFGVGFDETDIKVGQLKLAQGNTTLVKEDPKNRQPGEWYLSALGRTIGDVIKVVPVHRVKTYVIWGAEMGKPPLAVADYAGNWLNGMAGTVLDVELKPGKKVKWDLDENLAKSGLAERGTYDPKDETSAAAANLTYLYQFYLPDFDPISPVQTTFTRWAARNDCKILNGFIRTMESNGIPPWHAVFEMGIAERNWAGHSFYVPTFQTAGMVADEDLRRRLTGMASALSERPLEFTEDESGETGSSRPRPEAGSFRGKTF